jgi:hypothetical protein
MVHFDILDVLGELLEVQANRKTESKSDAETVKPILTRVRSPVD